MDNPEGGTAGRPRARPPITLLLALPARLMVVGTASPAAAAENSKGCGTSQAFSYQYNGTFPATFKVRQWAANSVTWSSVHCKTSTLARP